MSQKFILSGEKTAKKAAFFEEDRPKKFKRKRSEREHSVESKRSKDDSICSHYIKNPSHPNQLKISLINESMLFLDEFNTSTLLGQQTERKPRKTAITRSNGLKEVSREECTQNLKIKILETQMKAKDGECERFKLQAEEERDRRRRVQFDRKTIMKEAAALQKQNQDLVLQIKKLTKEKEILNKQIEFLEKINYDEKTRNIQSFRETHMQEELLQLKKALKSQKGKTEVDFQTQLYQIRVQKETAQQKFRSMESLVDVLRRKVSHLKEDLLEERMMTKQRIIGSDEYRELRDRFKRFIDQYKQVRTQNTNLKSQLQGKEQQLILSEQERQYYQY